MLAVHSKTIRCTSHPIGLLIGEVNETSLVISEVTRVLILSGTASGRQIFRYELTVNKSDKTNIN